MKKEWPILRARILKLKEANAQSGIILTPAESYDEIVKERDSNLQTMKVLTTIMLTIYPSKAACERGFSSMNIQKTKTRCHLGEEAMEDIMRMNIDRWSELSFDSSASIYRWIDEAKRQRHLKYVRRM